MLDRVAQVSCRSLRSARGQPRPLPDEIAVSLEVRYSRLEGLVCRESRGPLGSPRRRSRPVSVPRSVRVVSTVHRALPRSVSSFVNVPPLQSSFAFTSARDLSDRADCLGSGPLRDITRSRPLPRRIPASASFRPRALAAPRRFSPRAGSGACCIPEPRPGPVPFRGFSLRAAHRSRRTVQPPCRCSPGARLDLSIRRPHPKTSATRLRSTRRRVRTGSVMSLADGRSPPRVRLLQVPCASDGATASPPPTAHDVLPSGLRSRDRRSTSVSSVSPPRSWAPPSPAAPTCPRVPA